ncbi:unnamed protein product [Angiostrongylus costaricensis]|uniref:Transposase n=1 Tax=Angiostrongylus costaricensis TaxID=334426 RepID=A0A0R3PNJ9_ANGCS|nr:unnamed protein product [Angiostrongylus costaricensis]
MWIATGFDNLRRLRTDIELWQRRSRSILNGLGEVLQSKPYILQGRRWIFQCQDWIKKSVSRTSHWDQRIRIERTGERLFEFIMTSKTTHGKSQFQKPQPQGESSTGECHNEIDHLYPLSSLVPLIVE